MPTIDLNSDVGEASDASGIASEVLLASHLTSLNIACGGHAGDEASMTRLIQLAIDRKLGIGAHPSYPDRAHFGRVEIPMSMVALERSLEEQLVTIEVIARKAGATVGHVKPHGALYHAAARREVAMAIAHAAARVVPDAVLVGQCGSRALEWWRNAGCAVAAEAFADRVYEPDGSLRARSKPGAVIEHEQHAAEQARRIVLDRVVVCADGSEFALEADTLCVHGDTVGAERIAKAVRAILEAKGVAVTSFV